MTIAVRSERNTKV